MSLTTSPTAVSGLLYPAVWVDGLVPHGMNYTGEWNQLISKINEFVSWSALQTAFDGEVDSAFALMTDQINTLSTWVNTWNAPLQTWELSFPGIMSSIEYFDQQIDILLTDNSAMTLALSSLGTRVTALEVGAEPTDLSALYLEINDVVGREELAISESRTLTAAEVMTTRIIRLTPNSANVLSLLLPYLSTADLNLSATHPIWIYADSNASGSGPVKIWLSSVVGQISKWAGPTSSGLAGSVSDNYLRPYSGQCICVFPVQDSASGAIRWALVGGADYSDLESD